MDSWKAFERWESDRMQQPISLARGGYYMVPGAGVSRPRAVMRRRSSGTNCSVT